MTVENIDFLNDLEQVIRDRIASPSQESYTASLVAMGPKRIGQKIGEEGVELAIACVDGTDDEVLGEAADLVYHVLVGLSVRDLSLADVVAALESRHTG
ncbi:MAG: phosphoribosyl-ATP diphosphatase [Woeseiaceae bacterium]|nr:phosphoribosyl-ATP diphosphatase [Woeseiaceae bacterium]